MKELETSLKEEGFMQPLLVRPIGKNKYEVVAGKRRFMVSLLSEGGYLICQDNSYG